VPMHWTDGFCSSGPIARLVGAAVDPISGQPELKATAIRVEALAVRWRALLLHRRAIRPDIGCYWSRVPTPNGHAIELSGYDELRAGLLAAQPDIAAVSAGRTVCSCFSVGLATLRRAVVDQRLTTVDDIGALLRAGTNCGSCKPELREILRDAHASAA